jgi:flagellar motility protein MotE (MotC chaperone)
MIHALRTYRLIPIVLLATGCLFVLKSAGLLLEGGYTLGQRLALKGTETITMTVPASPSTPLRSETRQLETSSSQSLMPKSSWMQDMFGYPGGSGASAPRAANRDPIVTGSVAGQAKEPAASPPQTKPAAGAPAEPPPMVAGTPVSLDSAQPLSSAERAILERLHQRRQELEARARELDLRETLIKAAEKRLEDKLTEIKEAEARLTAGLQKKDDADSARFKGVVTMYETMKPRDAAKIFDRLDTRVMLEMAGQMNPRRMSEILAQMTPEAAEKLTVELAARSNAPDRAANPAELPKIVGKPSGS